MFTLVKTADLAITKKLHISHLYKYVSAYELHPEQVEDLVSMIEYALIEARKTGEVQIVDKDGEFCFHVSPGGYLTIMIPWKMFEIIREET
jgi:hypothetical protein